MSIRFVLIYLSLFFVVACQTTTQPHPFMGKHIDTLIATQGAPSGIYKMQNGGATYTFQSIKSGTFSGDVFLCNYNYSTNQAGLIVSRTANGGYLCM